MNYGGKQTKAEKNWSKLHYSHAFISQKLTDEGAKLRRFFFFFFFFESYAHGHVCTMRKTR